MTQSMSRASSVVAAIGLAYGSTIIGAVVILVVTTTLALFGIDVSSRPTVRLLVSTVFLQGVTFGGLAVLYLNIRNLDFDFVPLRIPDKREAAVIGVGTLALLGLLVAASTIISALGLESARPC